MTETPFVPIELEKIEEPEAYRYFLSSHRNTQWTSLSTEDKNMFLYEAFLLLRQIRYDQEANCPGGTFSDMWIAANCELALALSQNPTAVLGGEVSISTGTTGAIKKNKLGDLEQEYYDVKDGQPVNHGGRFGPKAPLVLQRFEWLWDLLGCYMVDIHVQGQNSSGLIPRVRS